MKSCFRALLALALSSFVLYSQGTTSRLIGTLTDATGAAVPGVVVRLTSEGTGQSFTTSTSENGAFFFEAIQVGTYSVAVEASGFKKFLAKRNVVNIGQPTTVNIALEVGTLAESVEVSGAYEQVQTSTSGNIGNVFSEKVIQDLPIVGTRGRNPLDLVLRQPGVVSGANTGGGTHVNGARDRAWNYTIDGIDANETSAGGSNFAPIRTNPDGLAEFKVLTSNATAEYGRNSGAQVAMVTKSGSNEFHGTGFYFYRTPRFNANEWENNVNSLAKRQFVQNIYGGSIGGPIKKNKLFFFGNLQRLAARDSAVVNRTVYTSLARQGLYRYNRSGRTLPAGVPGSSVDSSGNPVAGLNIGTYNIIASDPDRLGADPRVKGLIDPTPLPNNYFGGDGLNTAFYTFSPLQYERQNDVSLKFDYIVNDKNTVFARISWGSQNTLCDRGNGGQPFFPGGQCPVNTYRDPQNYAFNWRTNPTSRLTNEMVVGRNYFGFNFDSTFQNPGKISLVGAPVTIPEDFSVGNARKLNTWQYVDNLSYFAGAHSLKFGINFRMASHNDVRGSVGGENISSNVNFSRVTNSVSPTAFGLPADIQQANDRPNLESSINYILGRVGSIGRGFVAQGEQFAAVPYDFKALFNEYDFYVQDTWKLSRRLTIDAGLRLEMKMTPTSSPNGRIRRSNQNLLLSAAPTDIARWEIGKLFRSDRNNWAPSIGIAYDPTGKGKTAIRANYRIAYDRLNTFSLSSSVFQNLPGQAQGVRTESYGQAGGRLAGLQNIAPPTANPNALAQPGPYGAQSITVVDPNFETPATHMWSLGVQHQVANKTVIEVNYIGRRAYNLYGAYNANQVDITRNGFLAAYNVAAGGGESPLINQIFSVDPRKPATQSGSAFMRTQYATDIRGNSVAAIAQDLSRRLVGGVPIAPASGLSKYFFIPFPQFANGVNVIDSNDFSTYHGLQMQVERRMSGGLTAQLSYTWAKSLDTRSFDPAFTVVGGGTNQSGSSTPFDINNRRGNYAPSDFDRRHALQSYWIYELPFGKGRRFGNSSGKLLNALIGDWQLAGLMTITSGRPFTVYSGFNQFTNIVSATSDCNKCEGFGGAADRPDGIKWYFTPEQVAAFTNPAAGSNGSSFRNRFYGPGSFNMDSSFLKRVQLTERFKFEVRADMTNLTNTPTFGFPTTTANSTTFGRIRDNVNSSSRKIQLGAKFIF